MSAPRYSVVTFQLLYIAWLVGSDRYEVDEPELEPPVPPRLKEWKSTYLSDLCEFQFVDEDHLAAAVKSQVVNRIAGWPELRKTALLTSLVNEDRPVFRDSPIAQALVEAGSSTPVSEESPRTVAELRAKSEELRRER